MSRGVYFFGQGEGDASRRLPCDPDLPEGVTVAASAQLRHGIESLREEIASPQSRTRSEMSPLPFSVLYEMAAEYAGRYPTVTVEPGCNAGYSIGVSVHDLYFAIGTAIHYVGLAGYAVTLRYRDAEEPEILLSRAVPAKEESEVLSAFGLDREDRYATLLQLAADAGFALALRTGECAELTFRLTRSQATQIRLNAVDDPSYLAAFLLPLTYFHY